MDNKQIILDIAVNLNRIGNWAADDYFGKQKRIQTFLYNTDQYIKSLDKNSYKSPFNKTLSEFLIEYDLLKREGLEKPLDTNYWAEKMMTWGNILTHRSKLI